MKTFEKLFSISLLVFFPFVLTSQTGKPIPMISENDTIPSYVLTEVNVHVKSEKFKKEYENTKYYVLRVYEYGMLASAMLQEFEDSLNHIPKRREQNQYSKEVNDYLKEEFGEEIADMSITRGMYLMKIIHKETGLTTFDIIKTYQSGLKAMWWQTVVTAFGTSIKYEYDPEGEDAIMAIVLREIEEGTLKPIPREIRTEKAKQSMSKKEKKKLEKQNKKNAKNKGNK
jgi:hypothetical protein